LDALIRQSLARGKVRARFRLGGNVWPAGPPVPLHPLFPGLTSVFYPNHGFVIKKNRVDW
jgi:hypothetical protein